MSLEILGDFYISKGQKIKAKDIYDQAIKISDIPEIFKKDLKKKIKDICIKIKSDSILIQKIVVKNLKNIKDTSLVNDTLLIKKQFIENEKTKSIQNNLIKYNDSLVKLEKEYVKAKEINKNSLSLKFMVCSL